MLNDCLMTCIGVSNFCRVSLHRLHSLFSYSWDFLVIPATSLIGGTTKFKAFAQTCKYLHIKHKMDIVSEFSPLPTVLCTRRSLWDLVSLQSPLGHLAVRQAGIEQD